MSNNILFLEYFFLTTAGTLPTFRTCKHPLEILHRLLQVVSGISFVNKKLEYVYENYYDGLKLKTYVS